MMNNDKTPFSASEIAQMSNIKCQGKRPDYFNDTMSEHNFSISMALMAELAVARERINTLEQILIAKGVLSNDEIEGFVPSKEQGQARQQAQVEYSTRVLRTLQQDVETMAEKKPLTMDEMADILGATDESEKPDA